MNFVTLIAAAVLNSFWQAGILAFLIWLATRLLQPRLNAATRYIIWWLALAAIVLLPFILRTPAPIPQQQPHPSTVASALPAAVSAPLTPPAEPAVFTVVQKRAPVWPLYVFVIWSVVFGGRTARIVHSFVNLRGVKRRA